MEQKNVKLVWTKIGERFYLTEPSVQSETIDIGVYKLLIDDNGQFFLRRISDNFSFDYKLYGLETKLIDRVVKTYENTEHGNIGVLLNGLKGTGKTVSAKVMCNKLKKPVIVVSDHIKGCHIFLNSIPQDITIFIDEYEKIFGDSADMLTIMDGALNSKFRRVFMLTTNKLYVDDNLLQRPSRIRYMRKFNDLTPDIVEEIVDDLLIHKQFKAECVKFISNLEVITIDVVKAVISEVNIHAEAPETFQDVFNVVKLKGKYNVLVQTENKKFIPLQDDVVINPRPKFDESNIGRWFNINDEHAGVVLEVINFNTIKIGPIKGEKGKRLSAVWLKKPTIIKIEHADVYHYNYMYGGYDEFGPSKFKNRDAVSSSVHEFDESEED